MLWEVDIPMGLILSEHLMLLCGFYCPEPQLYVTFWCGDSDILKRILIQSPPAFVCMLRVLISHR